MEAFSFDCSFCNATNSVDFQQICNSYTIWYLKNKEINDRSQNEINNLIRVKIEKLDFTEKFIFYGKIYQIVFYSNFYNSFTYLKPNSFPPLFVMKKYPISCLFLI